MTRRRETALAALLYALLAALAFGRSFLPDRIFVPMHTDRFEPWRSDTTKERQAEISKDEYTHTSDKLISFRADDAITMAAMREGKLPLWNPTNACGVPYLAQGLYGFLYPPHWIWRWMSPERSYGILSAFHHFLAAFFTFLFVRRIGARFEGALFAGLAFAGSSCLLARAHYYQYIECVCWLPLGLLCVERWLRDRSIAALAGLAVVMALILLVGWPQLAEFAGFLFFLSALVRSIEVDLRTPSSKILGAALVVLAIFLALSKAVPDVLVLYAAYPVTTLVLVIAAGKDRKSFFATIGGVALALVLGALIASLQYLPAAEWAVGAGTPRPSAPDALVWAGMRPLYLLQLVAPGAFGTPFDAETETIANFMRYLPLSIADMAKSAGAAQAYGNPFENASYIGLIAIVLVPLGLLVRSPRRTFLALALLWFGGFAIGVKAIVYPAFFSGFVVGTDPRRALAVAAFMASCLAGLGLSHCITSRRRAWLPFAFMIGLVGFALNAWTGAAHDLFDRVGAHVRDLAAGMKWNYEIPVGASQYFHRIAEGAWKHVLGFGLLGAGTFLAFALAAKKRTGVRRTALLACVVLAIDSIATNGRFVATRDANHFLATHPLIEHLQSTVGVSQRLARFGAASIAAPTDVVLSPNFAGCFGLRDACCYTVSPPRRIERLIDALRYGIPLPEVDKTHPAYSDVFLPILTKPEELASRTVQLYAAGAILGLGDPPKDLPAGVSLDARFGDCYVLKNANALPRVFMVGAAEVMKSVEPDAVANRVLDPAFDPHAAVLLEDDLAQPAAGAGALPVARLLRDDGERLEIALDGTAGSDGGSSRGGYLVVLDTFAPGWEATVDGRPAPVVRGDFAFRAVPVPPGARQVVMTYAPKSVKIGIVVSCAGLLLTLVIGVAGLVRGPRPRVAGSPNRVIVADT